MHHRADHGREVQAAEALYRSKATTGLYDLVIEAWAGGAADVTRLVERLRVRGLHALEADSAAAAEKVPSVVFLIGQGTLTHQELRQIEGRFGWYVRNAVPVIFVLYRVSQPPDALLRLMHQSPKTTAVLIDNLEDEQSLNDLVGYIQGNERL
jgi:hypothetical protein